MIRLRIMLVSASLVVVSGCGSNSNEATVPDANRFIVAAASAVTGEVGQTGCVQDQLTGLVWERKLDTAGLRNWRNTYSWFNPEQAHDEMDYRGTADAGECTASDCDTWAYVAAVNRAHYCGFDDWRLPSRDELFSISDLLKAKTPPTIDTVAFPYAQADEYWSAHDYSFQPDSAWVWNFRYGHDRVDWKKSPKRVRLVRGEARTLEAVKE